MLGLLGKVTKKAEVLYLGLQQHYI